VSGWLRGGWGELRERVCWSRLFEGAMKSCGSDVTWAAEASNAATKSTFSTNPCVDTPLQQSVKHTGGSIWSRKEIHGGGMSMACEHCEGENQAKTIQRNSGINVICERLPQSSETL
jgi:hypothetical protein